MPAPHSELFKVVNQQAHHITRQAYKETRDLLRAKALLLLKQGWSVDKIVEAISKADFRQVTKF